MKYFQRILVKLSSSKERLIERIDNFNETIFIRNAFRFASDHCLVVHYSLEDYECKYLRKYKVFKCLLIILSAMATLLRISSLAILPESWLFDMMAIPLHLIASKIEHDSILVKICLWSGVELLVLYIFAVLAWQYLEITNNNMILNLIVDFKRGKLLSLNCINTKKFRRILFATSKLLLNTSAIKIIVLILSIQHLVINIFSYTHKPNELNLVLSFFWTMIFSLLANQIIATINIIILLTIFFSVYLVFKFQEIYLELYLILYFNCGLLEIDHAIKDHNTVSLYIVELNKLTSWLLFTLQYFTTPSQILMMILIEDNRAAPLFRLTMLFLFCMTFSGIVFQNILFSLINHYSRRPLKCLNRFLADNRLNVRQRIKTMAFIERLMRADIGFYCLDLFALNSHEFYLFVANCFKYYLLWKTILAINY